MRKYWKFKRGLFKYVSYIKHPFGVTCLDCGFLCFLPDGEIQEGDRTLLACKGSIGFPNIEKIWCYRGLWVAYETGYVAPCWDGLLSEIETQRRSCSGFIKYRSGWSPVEHKDILQKIIARKERLVFILLGSAIGVVGTLITELLT